MKIYLPTSDEGLLRECEVSTFRSSGPGGQHVNTTDSAVRLLHLPTGIVVSDQSTRSQHRNRDNCLRKLREEVDRRNYRKPYRVATKPSNGAVQRAQEKKQQLSQKKAHRNFRAGRDD